jgi:ABC-type transport system substrate-binding protein
MERNKYILSGVTMKKQSLALILILIFTIVATACNSKTAAPSDTSSPNATTPASTKPSELVIAANKEPVGFDPNKVPAESSLRIYSLIYDTLTTMDKDFNVKPSLADKWTFSEDGKTLTFNLHQGVKFHNGREFTSDDVKYTLERIMDPKEAALSKSSLSSINTIETPDKYTVVLKLKTADTAILANLANPFSSIVPKEITDLNKQSVGTGPFMMDKVDPGQLVTLKKNPNYFNKSVPKVDILTFRIMNDEAERMAAIRSGKIDLAIITNESAKLLENQKNVSISSFDSLQYLYVAMNVAKKPFDDVRVRQAISYAINRDDIVNSVWKGQAAVSGPMSPAQKAFALDVKEFPSYQHNLEKAKGLMKAAGYENGFETVIQTTSQYPEFVDTSQVVQQQLKEIGIKVEIKKMEEAAFVELWKSKKMDIMVGRNNSGTNPDRSMRFFFATNGSANVWNYSNPKYDDLVQKALETADENARKDIYNQAQKMLVEDSPNIFLNSPKIFYAVSSRVKDFVPTAAGEWISLLGTSVTNQ